MASLFPDHNQTRIRGIRAEAGLDDAEALARLFEDGTLRDDGTLPGRLRAILAATERRTIPGLHTGQPFRDVGFRGDRARGGVGFRDPWPSSRNQVGHFLTAVGLAFRPEVVSAPVFGIPLRTWLGADRSLADESVARRLTVGHELAPDPGALRGVILGGMAGTAIAPILGARGWPAPPGIVAGIVVVALIGVAAEQLLGFRAQLARATAEDEATFDRALSALGNGTAIDLAAAEVQLVPLFQKIDVDSRGNSYQDLRLSLLGWSLGVGIREGTMAAGSEVGAWVRSNLKAP
jgi:hypothetical protein